MKTLKQFIGEALLNTIHKGKGKRSQYVELHHGDKEWEPKDHTEEKHISTTKSGHHIYQWGTAHRTYHAYDPKIKKTTISVTGEYNKKSNNFKEGELASSKQNTLKAHDFYHHLITHHGISIEGNNHSLGAKKVWERLAKKKDVNVHGWDDKKKKPVNVTPKHEDEIYNTDTHHPRVDSPENKHISLVAHKK